MAKSAHRGRFEQEARAIAALNHPHICQIYDVGPDFLVLEYIEGKPLEGPMPLDQALRIAVQIAEALEAAHARNILHRDLKPRNVLVGAAGVKLLDFGINGAASPSKTGLMSITGVPSMASIPSTWTNLPTSTPRTLGR